MDKQTQEIVQIVVSELIKNAISVGTSLAKQSGASEKQILQMFDKSVEELKLRDPSRLPDLGGD